MFSKYFIAIICLIFNSIEVIAKETQFCLVGISEPTLQSTAEKNLTKLVKEINSAFKEKRQPKLVGVNMTESARTSVMMLWENSVFHCPEEEVVEESLKAGNNEYEVRNVPFLFEDLDKDDRYHEAAITFNSSGYITSFRLVIGQNLYRQVISQGGAVSDVRRRHIILDYVEQFRTSYNTKDLVFLNQVFSDDALIITGRVIQPKKSDSGINVSPKIEYTKQGKAQYLAKLSRIFKANKRVHVTFDKIKVLRHPTDVNWYGVTLHQGYSTDSYHDDGWVFLLWDFSIEDAPVIHVRTWQPDMFEGKELDENDIFGLEDCNIVS